MSDPIGYGGSYVGDVADQKARASMEADTRAALQARISALEAELAEARKYGAPEAGAVRFSKLSPKQCQHDDYWTTISGNCMACRAEKAESELAEVKEGRGRAIQMATHNHDVAERRDKRIDKLLHDRDRLTGEVKQLREAANFAIPFLQNISRLLPSRSAALRGEITAQDAMDAAGELRKALAPTDPAKPAEVKVERMFPLQAGHSTNARPGPLQIPWSVAEKAYGTYAGLYGRSQTLEQLAKRGGFSLCEMDELYPPWRAEVDEITTVKADRDRLAGEVERLGTALRHASAVTDSQSCGRCVRVVKIVTDALHPTDPAKPTATPPKFCPECDGHGATRGPNFNDLPIRCSSCHGHGVIPDDPAKLTAGEGEGA